MMTVFAYAVAAVCLVLLVPLSFKFATLFVQALEPSFVPPTPQSILAWLSRYRVRVRVPQPQPRGRLTLVPPPQVKVYSFSERAAKGWQRGGGNEVA
jgi:hypothetical protein